MARYVETRPPADASRTVPPPGKMTFEEFLEWADEDTFAEWADGEAILLSPASDWHQRLGGFLTALLRHFVESNQSGEVFAAPFLMKTAPDLPAREPDLLFLANEHMDRNRSTYLEGPADLTVEIVSPDSRGRDRGDKYFEYEQGGVREYWLLDPLRKQAEFYVRDDAGIYQLIPVGDDGIYRSKVLEGLWLKVEWLWQAPLPPLMSVLKEWGLV